MLSNLFQTNQFKLDFPVVILKSEAVLLYNDDNSLYIIHICVCQTGEVGQVIGEMVGFHSSIEIRHNIDLVYFILLQGLF